MQVALLGPIELLSATGAPLEVPAGKRRAVLAVLALELNRVVPVERFFDLVWDGEPPPQARAALQGHVAGLRKILDGSSLSLLTQSPGYILRGDVLSVDASEFGRLVGQAANEDDESAVVLLGRALALWRGEPLAGVPEGELLSRWRADLTEDRLRALSDWAERLLRCGRGSEATPSLDAVLRADGLREPIARLLMLCLLQEGRQSEAFDVYHRCRRLLAQDLGVVPGPSLQAAFASVLDRAEQFEASLSTHRFAAGGSEQLPEPVQAPSASMATRLAPRQLPRLQGGLVGRALESQWLDQQIAVEGTGTGLAVVTGAAGVGKSATVVRWAHNRVEDFPDGQLFVDLKGLTPGGPVDTYQICRTFLVALGIAETGIPNEPSRIADLYRSVTQSLRLLVVLDNAASAEAVRPLIPAGAASFTVVMSRNVLSDLVVLDGAASLSLGPLPVPDAVAMVKRMIGAQRLSAEPEMAHRLIELCDRLPLALRIALARLNARPAWLIGDLVKELEDEQKRLVLLDTVGDLSVTAALAATRGQLTADAGRLLALLALHPGNEIDVCAAAALLDRDEQTARRALDILSVFNLMLEASPGRFESHDLVRLYSACLLKKELSPDECQAARGRLLDYYFAATAQAGAFTTLHGSADAPSPARPPLVLPQMNDASEALGWFRKEEAAIRSLIDSVDGDAEFDRAWRLADGCITLYHGTGTVSAWLACAKGGLRAAERSSDPEARGRMLAAVGAALNENGRPAEALTYLQSAFRHQEALPLSVDLVRTRLAAGMIQMALGDRRKAMETFDLALLGSRQLGDTRAEALTLANVSRMELEAGRPSEALDRSRQARSILADRHASNTYLLALVSEAEALRQLRRWEESEERWREVLEVSRTVGNSRLQALAERQFAVLLRQLGRPTEVLAHLTRARDLYAARHDRVAVEQIERDIRQLKDR